MKLISGSAHEELSQGIARFLGQELVDVKVTSFPDGETFVKINENIRGEDLFIIQPTFPPTTQNLMELLHILSSAFSSLVMF